MNLWDKGKVLIALLMLSVLYTSCEEDDNTIGFPADRKLNVKYFEYNVPVEMLWVDNVISENTGIIYSGKYDLGEGGIVSALPFISYSAIRYDSNINVPHNAIFKDIYLNFDYLVAINDEASFIPLSFDIYQLAESISDEDTLYTSDQTALGDMVGQKDVVFYPDTLKAEQTSDTVSYAEVIDLDHTLGQFYFNKLKQRDPSVFYDYNAFKNSFKGLSIVSDASNPALIGINPATSTIVIEYTYVNDDGENKEGEFLFRPAKYYHNITPNKNEPDLSGSAFSGISCCHQPYDPAGDFVYQLFGTGINLKLDLSALKMFDDSLQHVVVNTAALVLDSVVSTKKNVTPPSSISFYLVNEQGYRLQDEAFGRTFYKTLPFVPADQVYLDPTRVGYPARIQYNSTASNYSVDITLYLQKLMENSDTEAHLLVENGDIRSLGGADPLSYLFRSSKRLSAVKFFKDGIKVKVYYSTVIE